MSNVNLKELKWPIRIYWDLPDEGPGTSLAMSITQELAALKVLFLGLRGPDAGVSSLILGKLKGGSPAVSLTLPGPALSAKALALLRQAGARTLLAEFSSLQDAGAWLEEISVDKGALPGLVFDVTGKNYHELPEVVSLCLRRGIAELVLPIQRLAGHEEVFCMTGEIRAGLAAVLGTMDYRRLRVTIHDPFLWQAFYPGAPYHEGGCQAANSMLYITPGYKVWPCPAMPLELGDLHKTNLREIMLSEGKRALRRTLLNPPSECAGCEQAEACLGGCRGRALAARASLDRRDPACSPG